VTTGDATNISAAPSERVEVPTRWINAALDVPFELQPPLAPTEDRPVVVEDFEWLWPRECLEIELRQGVYGEEREIPIPPDVLDGYKSYRPTPLFRARRLERALNTPAELWFKREDQNPGGSHKLNTALAQAKYAADQGIRTLVTDTGAGQWGTALAFACQRFGLDCVVFMVRKSFDEKPYRRYLMEMLGATVHSSPSELTEVGRRVRKEDPDSTGSLGMGMSEAIELVRTTEDHRLALGCMSYYAVMHQTVIGVETAQQIALAGRQPDVLIGCVGGGSNLMGFAGPYIASLAKTGKPRIVAAEPASVPCLTSGDFRYDWADYNRTTPRIAMYSLGSDFQPPPIHSGGLRYHGKTPLLSALVHEGFIEARPLDQRAVFEAGQLFFRTEGILPAPESAHAVLAAIDEARAAAEAEEERVIVSCLSGHGYLDLAGYADVLQFG